MSGNPIPQWSEWLWIARLPNKSACSPNNLVLGREEGDFVFFVFLSRNEVLP
jgi:hypothetical protein